MITKLGSLWMSKVELPLSSWFSSQPLFARFVIGSVAWIVGFWLFAYVLALFGGWLVDAKNTFGSHGEHGDYLWN